MSLIVILFGLIIGSFLNVVIVRLPHNQSIVAPRSRCVTCGKLIRWYDNIPVMSYLLLRGRCRQCKTRISARYPVIELLTAAMFYVAFIRFGFSLALVLRDWPFIAALIAIAFIDLEHRIIPDPLSIGGTGLGLATAWMVPAPGMVGSLAGAALGFGLFYGFAWGYHRLTGREGLGGGDVKLLAMIGAFVGPLGVFVTLFVSSILGSLTGIIWAYVSKQKSIMRTSLPYGPFLVIGALYYYLLGDLWLPFMNPT
jgi:leader peptidase (prepilin peptidase)/N-methyltransferase